MRHQVVGILGAGVQPPEFLLVPEAVSDTEDGPGDNLRVPDALPAVWQDFFDCLGKAAAPEFIARVACSPLEPAACEGIPVTTQSIFKAHLSPEALIQRHRLGQPEVKRVYQALQVYSLGFHQTIMETTCHALNKSDLLLAIWRGFSMLWDSALQTVFASETVKLGRDQQAAALSAEATCALLEECEASNAALAAQNVGLRGRMEGMVVEAISAKADATVLAQAAGALEVEVKQLRRERTAASRALEVAQAEAHQLRAKLQELQAPQELGKAERLGRLLEEKQDMLGASSRREAAAQQERDATQHLARAERLKRESAEKRAEHLQQQVDDLALKLRALQADHAAILHATANHQELEDRLALLADADTQGEAWRVRAEASEARAAALEEQLQGERAKNEELVDSFWPLAAKLKALEAQLSGGSSSG